MDADDENFRVVRAVKNDDCPSLREVASGAPEEIMPELGRTRMAVTEDIAALRVDTGHHVLDAAVFSGGIHGLEDDEQGMSIGGVEQLLLSTRPCNVLVHELLVLLLGVIYWIDPRRPALEVDRFARPNAEFFGELFHGLSQFPRMRHSLLGSRPS